MVQSETLQKWEIKFKKGFAKQFILFTLAKKPNYAYSLTRELNVNTNGVISINHLTTYYDPTGQNKKVMNRDPRTAY